MSFPSPYKIAKGIAKFVAGDAGTKAYAFDNSRVAQSVVARREIGEIPFSAFEGSGYIYSDDAMKEIEEMAGKESREDIISALRGTLSSFKNTGGITGDKRTNPMDNDTYKKMIEDYLSKEPGTSGARYDAYFTGGKTKKAASEYLGHKNGTFTIGESLEGYFGDPTYGDMRVKAGLAAYGGVALGARFLSGGDLTHNSRGENDIVGIPFF